MRYLALSCLVVLLVAANARAEEAPATPPSAEHQIAAAVQAAPEDQRQGATVLGYDAEGKLTTLRQGEGDLVCLADTPGDDRFHVACYFKGLEPFMARGRALKAEGKDRDTIQATRLAEIESGALPLPKGPSALYNLTGDADAFDPASGEVHGASPVFVVYIPYATEQSTGLSAAPRRDGSPWLMGSGKPWAHIMIIPPPKEEMEAMAPKNDAGH